jgi:hypothetical protein
MGRTTTALLTLLMLLAPAGQAQIPERFENLQYFPKDIPRDTLIEYMRGFSFTLGVSCQYCHAGGDGVSLRGVVFPSDEKPTKRKARYMLRMVDSINLKLLAALPDRHAPPVMVGCITCHRGLPVPATLEQVLNRTIIANGIDSAVAQYKGLRASMESGSFDFSEWSINEMARRLGESGKIGEAIRMLQLNQEYNPQSADIDFLIGGLELKRGEKDKAIARYRATLQKNPNHRPAQMQLQQLGVTP